MTDTLSRDDLDAVKTKQQATWASGDYAVIGTTLQIMGESLCEAVDLSAGWQVIDVAAGNGNATLAAARRGCHVTATDYVDALLEGTRRRAAAEGLVVETREADAEALPFADDTFDAALSTVGVMFTPNPARSAAELVRVCRPGGRIGLANWCPDGFVGRMFKIVGAHVPPPAGVPSPLLWGTDDRLQDLFGEHGTVATTRKQYVFRYPSAEAFFAAFRDYYGPVVKAWAALDGDGRRSFQEQLTALAASENVKSDGTLAVPSDYLEVVVSLAP